MRQADEFAFDPDVVATLDAIDATLAGQAVDPQYAEMAELALLVAAERPAIDPSFAQVLDDTLDRRFASPPTVKRPKKAKATWWIWAPSGAVATVLLVAVVAVLGANGGGGDSAGEGSGAGGGAFVGPSIPAAGGVSSSARAAAKAPAEHHHGAAGQVQAIQAPSPKQAPIIHGATGGGAAAGFSAASQAAASQDKPALPPRTLQQTVTPFAGPPTANRKVVQGAQLSLATSSQRVSQVAQEVFNVIGQQRGIVKTSRVTASGGRGGYAEFQLSVPSSNLAATMTALSNLQYAQVASRTDSSQDVTNTFRVDQRHLADDRALRTSLLKQLANAVTQEQVDSLTARIHDTEGAIARDESALNALNRQVGYSQVYLTINAGAVPVPTHSGGGGFTLRKAAHDAGHVLTVAAGVALIVLAALLPLALVFALILWIWSTVRRRRRLQALDLY